MAGRTQHIALGVYVLNASLRHPFLVASQLAVVQAASGGRLEVAVGLGSHYFARHDHQALGIPFPGFAEREARLETYCRILPALWRGESITDQALGLRAASLGPVGIVPPAILVGGKSERCLDIAVRYADGWHAPSMEPEEFASIVGRLDRASDQAGRPLLTKSVQLRPIDLGDPRESVDRFADAGASAVVFVLDAERGADAVRRLADQVL
jgi:alkanesulfonate monooxygenase SsuD/methylene tetrahydromethanopterin reductase-like flavin-dependent oxidoreductase (luciferase family)